MPIDYEHLDSYNDFDVLMMGDGSGTTIDKPFGWCVTIIDFLNKETITQFGGGSNGTNNFAELCPYVHSLCYYHSLGGSGKRICIISDSELTVKCGRGEYERRANLGLWSSIDFFSSVFDISWHHVPRNSTKYHELADSVSRQLRGLLVDNDLSNRIRKAIHSGVGTFE